MIIMKFYGKEMQLHKKYANIEYMRNRNGK